jgi:branched-chain amino acid transport system permease protein
MISLTVILQAVIYGIIYGIIYSLVALGFSLAIGIMNIVNFSHGHFIMIASFLTIVLFNTISLDPFISLAITVPFSFVLGAVVYKLIINKIVAASHHTHIMVTIGIGLVIENVLLLVFGGDLRSVNTSYTLRTLNFSSIMVSIPKLGTSFVSIISIASLSLFLRFTKLGKAIRAATDSPEGALLMGIDVKRIYLVSFGIAIASASIAGSSLASFYFISPFVGVEFLLKSFCIVVIGGLGNIMAIILGGLILGLIESVSGLMFKASWGIAFSFAIVILVLILKPSGLLGQK